jgi:hypothetical protein
VRQTYAKSIILNFTFASEIIHVCSPNGKYFSIFLAGNATTRPLYSIYAIYLLAADGASISADNADEPFLEAGGYDLGGGLGGRLLSEKRPQQSRRFFQHAAFSSLPKK